MTWTKAEMTAYTPNHPGTHLVLQGEASEDRRWFVAKMGGPDPWGVSCYRTGARVASFERKWHARAFCVEMTRRIRVSDPPTVYAYVCDAIAHPTDLERSAAQLRRAGIVDVLREYDDRDKAPPAWLARPDGGTSFVQTCRIGGDEAPAAQLTRNP